MTGRGVGGAAEHVLLLARRTDPERFDVRVAMWGGGPVDRRFGAAGVPVTYLDRRGARPASVGTGHAHMRATATIRRPDRWVVGVVRLVRLMRAERVHIVHTHTTLAGLLGRLAACIARVPVRVHMVHSVAGHPEVPRIRRWAYRVAERVASRVTTHYVVGSAATQAAFSTAARVDRARVTCISNAIDPDEPRSALGGVPRWRAGSEGLQPAVRVGFVGRLEKQKGIDLFVEAAALVADRAPTARFVVVGDGSWRRRSIDQAARAGLGSRVVFEGWCDEVPAVMRELDIVVVPSRWEPFGLVNLEAMAASRPIVAFAVDGIPEVVLDGETGLLVNPGDVRALSDAIVELVHDPTRRTRLGEAGHHRWRDEFSASNMVHGHEQLYESLCPLAASP